MFILLVSEQKCKVAEDAFFLISSIPLVFQECESSFIECVETELEVGPKAFRHCMNDNIFPALTGCTIECAPTFEMLQTSENPVYVRFDNFGPGMGTPSPRPDSSLCVAN